MIADKNNQQNEKALKPVMEPALDVKSIFAEELLTLASYSDINQLIGLGNIGGGGGTMFHKIVNGLVGLSHFLENLFVTLLKGLQNITMFLGDAFETLAVFIDVFGFLIFQLTFHFLKLSIIFLPGLAMTCTLFIGHYVLGAFGIIWLLVLLTAIFGFKSIAKENGSIEAVPEGWLWYFPYHWIKNDTLRPILSEILEINNSLQTIGKECDANTVLGRGILKLVTLASKKLKLVRKKVNQIQKTTSHHFAPSVAISLEQKNASSLEYLTEFKKKFELLKSEVQSLFEKHQAQTSSDKSEDGISNQIQEQIKNIKQVVTKLDEIELDFEKKENI